MYNNFIKLTEQYRRDDTRAIYINPAHIISVTVSDGKTRIRTSDAGLIDVLESIDAVFGTETSPVLLTDKVEDDGY